MDNKTTILPFVFVVSLLLLLLLLLLMVVISIKGTKKVPQQATQLGDCPQKSFE